jgi:hypothetical protein
MSNPKKPTSEVLGTLRGNNGRTEDLVRELDPEGKIVEHRIKRSTYAHDRLYAAKQIPHELYTAAEKFRIDFERAQMVGNYSRLDLFKTRAGQQEISDRVAQAKIRITKAINAVGGERSSSCLWSVVGLGLTLEGWTEIVRRSGNPMNADKSSGVLYSALESLALHYGYVDRKRLDAIGQEMSFKRGIRAAIEFIEVFATTAQGGEKATIGRIIDGLEKRIARHQ